MTFKQLLLIFVLAKVSGGLGIVLMFMHHLFLAGSLFALDICMLAVVVFGAYQAMTKAFAEPIQAHSYLW